MMQRIRFGVNISTFTIMVVFTAVAFGHHSFNLEFDREKPVTLEGSFVKIDWVNPHSWLHIAVVNEDGSMTEWAAETPPPNQLYRQGWRKNFFNAGEALRIEGFRARDGSNNVWANAVYLEDGTRVLQMFGGDGPPDR